MAGRYKKITFGPYALGALVAFLTTFYTEIGVTRGIVFQFVLFQALLLILLGVGLALLWTPSSRVLPIFLGETFSNWALVSGSIVLLNLAYILLTYVGLLYLVVVSSAIGTFLLVVTIFVIQRSAKEYLTRALRWREDG